MQHLVLELPSESASLRGWTEITHIRGNRVIGFQRYNTVTDLGRAIISGALIATGTPPTHIAIGTGTPSTTALGAETHRQSAARSQVTTTITNDTAQYEYTFAFAGGYSITEAGLFNAASGPTMVCSQTFTAVVVVSGDSLRITWKLQA